MKTLCSEKVLPWLRFLEAGLTEPDSEGQWSVRAEDNRGTVVTAEHGDTLNAQNCRPTNG